MDLPILPPIAPMLAKSAKTVPTNEASKWSYEPKWDGFRAIVFRDGDDVYINSRGGKDLSRYFPELVEAVRHEMPDKCVVDGEIGVGVEHEGRRRLDWESLSQRIHPATSRINKLSAEFPATFIGFDVLVAAGSNVSGEVFAVRRDILTSLYDGRDGQCRISRCTNDSHVAVEWLSRFEGAGVDGVVAKRLDGVYSPGKRDMIKVKHARTADCVVMGYRIHKSGSGIGSMMLGLYHGDELCTVGGIGAFTTAKRREYQRLLEQYRDGDRVTEGEQNRWNTKETAQWVPVDPKLVVEVDYDQMEGSRFRHAVTFKRWRPDREPQSCTFDQLDVPATYDLDDVLETP